MSRIIIGFTGAAGSGKTTAAQELVESKGFKRLRMAGPLKAMLHTLGLTKEEIDGSLKEKPCALLGGVTPRRAQQTLGTEWGRELIHPDIWVNAWKQAVDGLREYNIVCDDVRFVNELNMIKSMGGMIVYITRGKPLYDWPDIDLHPSEQFCYNNHSWDVHVHNDSSLDAFKEVIRKII